MHTAFILHLCPSVKTPTLSCTQSSPSRRSSLVKHRMTEEQEKKMSPSPKTILILRPPPLSLNLNSLSSQHQQLRGVLCVSSIEQSSKNLLGVFTALPPRLVLVPPTPRVRLTPLPKKGEEVEKKPGKTVPNSRLALSRATGAQPAVPRAPAGVNECAGVVKHGWLGGVGESCGL